MATTSPDNLWTPDAGDDYALVTDLAAFADTVQTAISANRLPRGTTTQRNAFPSPPNGLIWSNTTTNSIDRYNGSTWDTVWTYYPWTTLVAASGWTAGTGSNAPQVMRVGETVWYRGSLFGGTANTTATTVPSWAAPSRTSRVWVGLDTNAAGYARIFTSGVFQPSGTVNPETNTSWQVF